MSTSRERERGLVVLSLDGGGIRGLSSLLILQELMTRLQHKLGLDKRPEVYEHFDIVGGTGTGGISAVMLGRLRIPLSQAIDHFAKLGEDVFSKNSFFSASNAGRSRKMQRALKSIIREATGDEDERMIDDRSDAQRCNTVVFAMARHNMNAGLPREFRSYQAWENQMPNYTIWEVLCATTAYPDLFDSVNIGDAPLKQPFIGGCLGCNNPLPHILAEVKLMYPNRDVGCVISIGAGHARTIQFPTPSPVGSFLPNNIIETLKAIAMDSEGDAQQMATRFVGTHDLYFRLNVDQGMQSVELEHWERMGEVVAHTQGYMRLAEVSKSINGSVEAIKNKNRVVPARYVDGQLHIPTNQPREEQIDPRLDRLSPATDARYNSLLSATMTKRRACTANTRTEVLANAHTWTRDDKGAKIYWMNGMAGTGKTTIAYSLCKGLEENKQLGASFFCSRDSPTCRDVAKLVSTVSYQLGCFSSLYRQAVCNVLNEDPHIVHEDIEAQFQNLIAKPLREVKTAIPTGVVVVIDALDELADITGTQQVLNMLFRHTTQLPIKFFVTSRPEPGIVTKMTQQDSSSRSILHLHDIEQSLVQADIRTYFQEALAPIRPSTNQIEQLTAQAGRLFIFAATIVRYISPEDGAADHEDRLLTMLNATPNHPYRNHADLDVLYSMILFKAFEGGTATEIELRRTVLRTVVCARETMTISALAEILGVRNERKVELATKPLRSVLHVSERTGVVSTLHASFTDFLLNEERAGLSLYCPEAEHNTYLVTRCFEVMKRSLRFNICGLESSSRFDKDVPNIHNRVDNAISVGLFYACRYWGDHLLGAATPNILVPHFHEFLRHRLLFWMEVLNLKGWIGRGEDILSQALSWIPSDNTLTKLRQFTYDARNFVTTFAANPTSHSTPHIYLSVLPFTSTQSHVRTNYWPRTRGLLRVEGTGMEARGRAALATWNVGSKVMSIAQSGDGKRIVSGCEDGTVSIWDVSKGARTVGPLQRGGGGWWVWEGDDGVSYGPHVAFSFDGTRIVSCSHNHTIRIWDARNGNPITDPITGHTKPVLSVAFSPDGTRLISGSEDHTIRMWDARNGDPLGNPFQGHQDAVLSIVFSPDGKRIASGSSDCTILIWDVHSATTIVGPLTGHTRGVHSVAFSPDGLRVVSGSRDGTVRVWDVQSGTVLADPFGPSTSLVMPVAFSPDGTRVVSGSLDGTIHIWDAQNGTLIAQPEGHRNSVNSVLFSMDGTRILSGCTDGTICIWDARPGETAAAKSSGLIFPICSVAFSPDGTRVVSGSRDTIHVRDTRDGRLVVGPLKGHTSSVISVAFSRDGAQIVSGSSDRTVRTWDARSGAYLEVGSPLHLSVRNLFPSFGVPFKDHTKSVLSVAYSPDGRRIASAGDRTIRVWKSRTGKLAAKPFMGHTSYVRSVAWSPDGTRIASGSWDRTVRMWLAHDGTPLWTSRAHSDWVNCVAYSPDGTRVASGSNDRTILVLNAIDGTVLHGPFKGHTGNILSVAFSPDGTRIVSGSKDHRICACDAQNGTAAFGPFRGHTDGVQSVAFSPDGRRVVSCSDDGTIRFWEVPTDDNPYPTVFDQCTLRDDGWVTHSDSQLLMWLPPDLRTMIPLPCSLIISPKGSFHVDYNNLLVGERWNECYRDSETRTVACS